MKIKVGIGYDIHKLVEGNELCLGGIKIPFSKKLSGHSDGDCLIHAIIDALLGAEGKSDIGRLFPDSDPQYKNISSRILLKKVAQRIRNHGYEVVNIDSILIAEKPKMNPYFPEMKKALCSVLNTKAADLGLKAKSNEGLGEIGRGEAIAAWASAVLKRI
ncbi:MAG: 2-C-methyl-D-erythritol 2,4-cyclodiphosphate synthase [Candidatus Aminicenantes bacterium]|nr:2-C-methyl-D-erythritol 2,4-cyclodiphosphate synthase [Candidatus Aminicenantes bacterium]